MTKLRATAALLLAGSIAGLVALAPAGESATPEPTPERSCETRVESSEFTNSRLPRYWRRHAVRAGPVVFLAGEYASRPATDFAEVPGRPRHYYAQKLLLLVRARAVATVVVPRRERGHIALLYDRSKFDVPYRLGYRIAGGAPAVRFRACPQDHPAFRGRGTVGAWTEFNGGIIVAGARCADIAVLMPGRADAIRRSLAFGVDRRSCRPGQARSRG